MSQMVADNIKRRSKKRASSLHKGVNRPSFKTQARFKGDEEASKEIEERLKARRAEKRRERNEARRLKDERKKEETMRNAVKFQGAQFIDTRKVKKLDKKARSTLMKMSPEYIAQHFGKKSKP